MLRQLESVCERRVRFPEMDAARDVRHEPADEEGPLAEHVAG